MSVYRVISSVERGCLLWLVCSLDKTLLACACFILFSKPKPSCFSGYLLTFYFGTPAHYDEKTSFLVLILEGLVGLHRSIQLQLLQHSWLEHRLGLLWCWMVCPGNEPSSFCPCDNSYNVMPMISSLVSRKQAIGEQWFCLSVHEVEVFQFSSSCPRLHIPPVGWWGHS